MADYRLNFSGEEINKQLNITKYQSNENYLLNPTFTINQRGETSYNSASSTGLYTVDRWRIKPSGSATQDQNTLKWTFALSDVTSATSKILMEQEIENYSDFAGLKMTASIKYSSLVEDVSGTTQLSIYDGVDETTVDLDSTQTIAYLTHTINVNPTKLIYRIKTKSTGLNASIIPVYCKLEIGEDATPNIPRQISEDLWLCQRYYQKVLLEGQTGNYISPYYIQPTLSLPNILRTTPTITVITSPYIYGNGVRFSSDTWTFKKMVNNRLSLTVQNSSSSPSDFSSYYFYCLKSGELELDAEIYDS